MDKRQMAEWLAENVLECTYCKDCDVWVSDTVKDDIVHFVYSPDGFFAVWDAVEKKYHSIGFGHVQPGKIGFGLSRLYKSYLYYTGEGYGKDRYEAFYKAVYEAMK